MSWTTLFFSFQGRINRSKYWLTVVVSFAVWIAYAVVGLLMVGRVDPDFKDFDNLSTPTIVIFAVIAAIIVIGAIWSWLAVSVKRLHDRDKSGWWLLLFWLLPSALGLLPVLNLVGFAISIWAFVEFGCLRGTDGSNRFGPDPTNAPTAPTHLR